MRRKSIELASEIAYKIQNKGKSWPELLRQYSWRSYGPEQTLSSLFDIECPRRPLFRKIASSASLSSDERIELTKFAQTIFIWGGVQRSNSKAAENSALVESVIKAALSWRVPGSNVPMNSGWTKVAALATEFVELDGGAPQVIFDSRVAASLLTRLDSVLDDAPNGARPAPFLPEELRTLGYVPGRGGTRNQNGHRAHRLGWPNRYRRWDAQFAASRLVNEIRKCLNRNILIFGRMPFSPYPDGRWSARGIEMVLFMDGR